MTSSVDVEPIRLHTDARGAVFEPLGADLLPLQRNVHVAISAPGVIRGNHYHRQATERMTVVGPALVRLREGGQVRDVSVPAGAAYRLTIPPGVSHAIQHPGPLPGVLVAFGSQTHDPADTVPDRLLEPPTPAP